MTLLLTGYDSKKELKASIGEPLHYEETSLFGAQFVPNGTLYAANRPHLTHRGREFFAEITMVDGKIAKVA